MNRFADQIRQSLREALSALLRPVNIFATNRSPAAVITLVAVEPARRERRG